MYDTERQLAAELAVRAGKAVLDYYQQGAEVSFKAQHEPLTEADLASNAIILDGIRQRFPDDPILSEESKDDLVRLDKERVWIIDPLDGTQEFVDAVGQFAVMIGLAVNGEPKVGAVYQPVGDRLWLAAEGWGAVLVEAGNTHPLEVGTRTNKSGLRLVVTRSHPFAGLEAIKADLGVVEVHRLGSVGLKVGAIAADEADLYVHISKHTKEWDSCAPHAVLSQAGGRMTDLTGQPLRYNKADVRNALGLMASSGPVHDRAVVSVRPWLAKAGMG